VISTKEIEAAETYSLRQEILRPQKPIEQCQFSGDCDSSTAHFGVYSGKELVGILSVFNAPIKGKNCPNSWQLRAMAVKPQQRGKGYGLLALAEAEAYAIRQGGCCIWANARINAVGFYQRAGYCVDDEVFNIPDVGPHQLVYKALT